MTVEECYIKMGANYQDVIKRLPSVSMIEKFALKFREDTSFQELEKALNDKQVEIAFRAAHTLKGVCMNLGFDHLYKPSLKSQKVYVQETWNWLYNNLMQSKSNILKQLIL